VISEYSNASHSSSRNSSTEGQINNQCDSDCILYAHRQEQNLITEYLLIFIHHKGRKKRHSKQTEKENFSCSFGAVKQTKSINTLAANEYATHFF